MSDAMIEYERLPIQEQIKREFGPALQQIAKALKIELDAGKMPTISLDIYKIIETDLERRVMQWCHRFAYDAVDDYRRHNDEELYRARDTLSALVEERDQLRASLQDPAAVHVNILRGDIKLTRDQALHIAGATDYDSLKARFEEVHKWVAACPLPKS